MAQPGTPPTAMVICPNGSQSRDSAYSESTRTRDKCRKSRRLSMRIRTQRPVAGSKCASQLRNDSSFLATRFQLRWSRLISTTLGAAILAVVETYALDGL